jgi:hypothetical protein
LYPNLVFRFGIGWYFPGIFPTDTEGKLGRDISVEPMTLYVALVQKTMGHSFGLVGVCELNYSVLDKNRPVVDQN